MKTPTTLGLSILAGGLAFVGSANAVDLIVNGSFEVEGQVPGGSVLTGWTGFMGTYRHSDQAYYAGPAIPDSENPGLVYSWQHRAVIGVNGPAGVPQVTQLVDLTTALATEDIDAGRGQYTFSSWLASYTDNPEQPYLTLQFFDETAAPVGTTVIFDRTTANFWVTNADPTDTTPPDAFNHMFSKYLRTGGVPPGARTAEVGIGRSPNAGLSGSPDTYVDLVKLDVETVALVLPSVTSLSPVGTNTPPNAVVAVALQDGSTHVDTNSVQLLFDGLPVSPVILKSGLDTTITYDPPGLLPPLSAHIVRTIFGDDGAPANKQTNEFSFAVLDYYNVLLPAPIYLETFDTTPEGGVPPGWTQVSYSAAPDLICDPSSPDIHGLQDLNSACYTNWIVIDSGRFTSNMFSYNSHTPITDYQRVLSTNFANVVNGAVVENLANGNIAFGDSGYRDGSSQVLYLFSKDFDLTGHTNVYLSFHSLWEQNQDSVAAVEYSIDQGVTWLPVVYLLDGPDVILDGLGKVDPVATLGTVRIGGFQGQPTYVDPISGLTVGGYYGAFIGVESNRWSQLGPYISPRLDDDPVDSKRVEVFRLAAADNSPTVRLRFAHAGTDSWYFGIDDVGFFSLSVVSPPGVHGPAPAAIVDAVGNTVSTAVSLTGIGPFQFQWQHDGVNLPGQTNASLTLANIQLTNAGNYTAIIGYLGGSVTSSPASLVVFTPEPARVVGQWDFTAFDLTATCGQDLEFFDANVQASTIFSDTDFQNLPSVDGQVVNVMQFPGNLGVPMGGYKMKHGLGGTAGGTNVNRYTLIMDLLYPPGSDAQRRSLLQTDPSNSNDTDVLVNESNGVGANGVGFDGTVVSNTWNRIAFAVDLAGPGPNPVIATFLNGIKVGQRVLPEGLDGRWSLSASADAPWALLFADNDVDVQSGYVSSIQLRAGRLSDAAIAAMGGVQATKIPGAICAQAAAGKVMIHWSGSSLEQAGEPGGPWAPVLNAPNPYQVPTPLTTRAFFRSR